MTQYLSDKLKVISFLAIILVLYIHSGFHEIPNEIAGMTFNIQLQRAICGMLGRTAVPSFFMISGYLFFLHTENGMKSIRKKMQKRVKTLLIPYIIGCLFVPLFWVVMEQVPFAARFCNGKDVTVGLMNMSLPSLFIKLFYMSEGSTTPMAFQLWFLRDLIIIVMFSPLLYIVRNSLRWGTVIIIFAATYLNYQYAPFYSLFWFMLGSMVKTSCLRYSNWWLPISYITVSILQMASFDWQYWQYLRIPLELLGVCALWMIYEKCVSSHFNLVGHRLLTSLCSFTFFIYLFHEPTLNIVRKVLAAVVGENSIGFAVSYVLSPWIFAGLWVAVGYVMKRYVPRFYGLCSGGR